MKVYFAVIILFLHENSLSLAKVRLDCACGESNTRTGGRIVNGKATVANKYPWIAAMYTPTAFMCGGAIISDRNIITAGHCVFYAENVYQTYWVLGMHDQRLKDGAVYNVAHYELHPKFINLSYYDDYDMALITVTKKIRFGPTVKPICLPTPRDDFTGRAGIVAGWGRLDESNNAMMAAILMETRIRVKPNSECRQETTKFVNFNPESMICGYEYNKDACQGDSGGPFFIETDANRYEIFGVVSFGEGCGRNSPGIYGRLTDSNTLKWINQYMTRSQGDVCSDLLAKTSMTLFNSPKTLFDEISNLLSL